MPPLAVRLAASRFLDPLLLILVALGVVLWLAFRDGVAPAARTRRAQVARRVAWALWVGTWLLSMPIVSATLGSWVEMRGPDLDEALAGKDLERAAIVVLAGGIRTYEPTVPLSERMDGSTTARVLTGASVWKAHPTGIVLLSGGPRLENEGMVELMTRLGVPPERLAREHLSTNTRENAGFSAEILRRRGVETVVLVTSATHLRRALKDFERAGVTAIPVASELIGLGHHGVDSFLPSAFALGRTAVAVHEILGYVRG
jgi:uncharacterized SAM-binding protein YcdF (DUF218 family)